MYFSIFITVPKSIQGDRIIYNSLSPAHQNLSIKYSERKYYHWKSINHLKTFFLGRNFHFSIDLVFPFNRITELWERELFCLHHRERELSVVREELYAIMCLGERCTRKVYKGETASWETIWIVRQ